VLAERILDHPVRDASGRVFGIQVMPLRQVIFRLRYFQFPGVVLVGMVSSCPFHMYMSLHYVDKEIVADLSPVVYLENQGMANLTEQAEVELEFSSAILCTDLVEKLEFLFI